MTGTTRLQHGDCRKVLAGMPDASIDAVVTDPPYELGFMGKRWDAAGIAYDVAMWAEVLRVLKPGGYLLAFGGTRTYHRMAVAIEDAGFEIRDSINWVYGSGFPKSLDVSKAIDKQRDDRAEVLVVTNWICETVKKSGKTHADILRAFGFNDGSGMVGHWTARTIGSQPSVPTLEQVPTLLDVLGVADDEVPEDVRRLLWDLNGRKGQPGENWARREVVGTRDVPVGHAFAGPVYGGDSSAVEVPVTAPATPEAAQWDGWGTALKPAHEPIVVARKPLVGTVAANVLEWGTGALNIDGCRVGGANGRWPANVVLTHHADCRPAGTAEETVGGGEADTSGFAAGYESGDGFVGRTVGATVWDCHPECPAAVMDGQSGDSGGPSRYFTQTEWDDELDGWSFLYQAKANKRERNAGTPDGNKHPTVKPVALMRWLIRLVTPPGGTVLDPFTGSGTTGVAATLEGFTFVGIEQDDDYIDLAAARISHSQLQTNAISRQAELFDTDGNVT